MWTRGIRGSPKKFKKKKLYKVRAVGAIKKNPRLPHVLLYPKRLSISLLVFSNLTLQPSFSYFSSFPTFSANFLFLPPSPPTSSFSLFFFFFFFFFFLLPSHHSLCFIFFSLFLCLLLSTLFLSFFCFFFFFLPFSSFQLLLSLSLLPLSPSVVQSLSISQIKCSLSLRLSLSYSVDANALSFSNI
jgi:hypothetical protein